MDKEAPDEIYPQNHGENMRNCYSCFFYTSNTQRVPGTRDALMYSSDCKHEMCEVMSLDDLWTKTDNGCPFYKNCFDQLWQE